MDDEYKTPYIETEVLFNSTLNYQNLIVYILIINKEFLN